MSEQAKNAMPPATAWWSIATKFYSQGQWAEAANALRQAIDLDPQNAALWSDLGAAEQCRGDSDAAAVAYQNSLALQPNNLGALANLAFLFVQQGYPQRAIELLRPVYSLGAAPVEVWSAAGHAFRALGDFGNAVTAFQNNVALAPNDLAAQHNLAVALRSAGKLTAAEAAARQVLAQDPNHAEAWSLLGSILQSRGQMEDAVAAFRRSVERKPNAGRHSNLLLALQYAGDVEPVPLLAAHRQWDAAYARPLTPDRIFPNGTVDPQRSLRFGFVSSQFGEHPIGFFALRPIECLDRSQCTVVCYSGRTVEDEYTARFRAASDLWRTTANASAEQLAAQIRADQIDILIDLMGHTSPQLLAFAHRPAPLQITWLGYPGTTGMTAMDALLADSQHIRPGEESAYSEQVLRMPHGYACYGPPPNAPDVGELPALQSDYITFGCFNNPAKFSATIIQAWAEILNGVPRSRLLLKFFGLDDAELKSEWLRRFEKAGIDSARVAIEGGASHTALLETYRRVDLALDTQPYSGGLTTCEALWMGVPVITFPGKTFAGRHSASHLTTAGLTQFVAADRAGYVELAVSWATWLNELARLRQRLRPQMAASPLCDAPRFARDFLELLQSAWKALPMASQSRR